MTLVCCPHPIPSTTLSHLRSCIIVKLLSWTFHSQNYKESYVSFAGNLVRLLVESYVQLFTFICSYLNSLPGTRYLVASAWCQVPSTWLPGTKHLVPCTWCLVPGTWYQVPGAWYQVTLPGTKYLVPGTEYLQMNATSCNFVQIKFN